MLGGEGVSATGGWVVSALEAGGVCSQRGVCSGGSALGGVSSWGGGLVGNVCSWGVSAPRGCLLQRGSGLGGCLLPGGVPGQVLPPVDRHTPVNILPCPKLRLRVVTKQKSDKMLPLVSIELETSVIPV